MLSRADFEDLFPDLFGSIETPIARWEDDGGRHGETGDLSSLEKFQDPWRDTLTAE